MSAFILSSQPAHQTLIAANNRRRRLLQTTLSEAHPALTYGGATVDFHGVSKLTQSILVYLSPSYQTFPGSECALSYDS